MRFAGDLVKQANPNDIIHPKNYGEVYHHELQKRTKPIVPSFNPEDLQDTPEMRPGPYYPGQDLRRDQYIRNNPGSGVAKQINRYGPPLKNIRGTDIPDIPRNRYNEKKQGIDVWSAPDMPIKRV